MLTHIICKYRKDKFRLDECLACALSDKIKCPYTYSMLLKMLQETRTDEDQLNIIHVTDLLACPRQAVFKKLFAYADSIDGMYARARGTAFHHMLEKAVTDEAPHILKELEVSALVKVRSQSFTLKGRVDELDTELNKLVDYKSIKQVPVFNNAYRHHADQLRIYAWLLRKNGYKVEHLEVVYMDPIQAKKIKVVDKKDSEIRAFIVDRLNKYLTILKKPEADLYELGWHCKYCPVEIRARCWALIIYHSPLKGKNIDIEHVTKMFIEKTPIDFGLD